MSDVIEFSGDFDEGEPVVHIQSIAESIKADITRRRERRIPLVHPDVPALRATYRLPNDRQELSKFYKIAESHHKNKKPYDIDAAILAAFNVSLEWLGELLVDESGTPLTFRDEYVMQIVDAISPSAAVQGFYVSAGVVSAVADQLQKEAGYGSSDDVQSDEDGKPDPF